ncbi:Rrf2 family transcriptional regulator [Ruminococcaceae bacterium OttesenSCG-928-L11]|nr:Rrf2 family transcriptional regulator [Ruminococcaceae bacterium OttesenSCG-928-L11]
MHITLETDYAIRIVDCLARNRQRMGAQAISEQNGVTLRFSLKILSKLVAAGIVRSYKGAQGGYEIARPLDQISLNDILETIEGPYQFSRCLSSNHICTRNEDGHCRYHMLFERLSEQIRTQLKETTMDRITAENWK